MLPADTKLISVDDHVVEPPNVFVDHIDPRHRDRAPRIVERDGGVQGWLWEDRFYPMNFVGNAHTRVDIDEDLTGGEIYATRFEQMIPAVYDVDARVEAMDLDGVEAALIFPQFPRFGGTMFLEATDLDLAHACVRAWNDWMLDEWSAAHPTRFIPQVITPLWDPELAAAEIRRCADKGARAVAFIENPHPLGLPSFPTGAWDPVFAASAETGLPLSMHIGTSSGLPTPSPESSTAVGIALCGMNSASAMVELIFGGVLEPFGDCRIALSEGGAGWVPYVLERMDYTWKRSRWQEMRCSRLPSDMYRQHFWVCMIADEYAVANLDRIGVDKVMWECDFPHNDSNYPNSRKVLADALAEVPDDHARAIAEGNARALYRFG